MNGATLEGGLKQIKLAIEKAVAIFDRVRMWQEAGNISAKPARVYPYATANRNVGIYQGQAEKKKINLINGISMGEHRVFADEGMLDQIFQNLITNALKFTSANGVVALTAKSVEGGKVEISVMDTGVGMTPEYAARLFEKDNIYTTDGTAGEKGTGFGLNIVKELVEKNGGNIRVKSKLGKGTTFTITLPAAESEVQPKSQDKIRASIMQN